MIRPHRLQKLARKHGTPLFVVDHAVLRKNYRLFKKHEFQIAGLRSFDEYVTDEFVAEKRKIADQYRTDPALFARVQAEAAAKIAGMPVMAKGVQSSSNDNTKYALAGAAVGVALLGLVLSRRKK